MGTKETCERLLKQLYEKADKYANLPNEFKTIRRQVELVNILKSLGLFSFYYEDACAPAVSYRGHIYVFDILEPYHLSFYVDAASFDDDDDEVRQEMYALFNEVNWSYFSISAYEVNGSVVLISAQYVGERNIFSDEVMFMLKTMDHTLREFQDSVMKREYLKHDVRCV